MDAENCTHDTFRKVHETTKSGHKGPENRNDTVREIHECTSCGVEGRKFVDGVAGDTTFSGAMRQ